MKRRVLSFVITLALCLNLCPVWVLAADEGAGGGLCPHHLTHTDECGYVPDDPDAPCTFVCQICPIEDLISELPGSVSADSSEQVQARLREIYALYDKLTGDEQQQVDLSPCVSLQNQMEEMDAAVRSDAPDGVVTSDDTTILDSDKSYDSTCVISKSSTIDTNGHTLTVTNSNAIQVTETGQLYLIGTVVAPKGAGVEVLSGGSLRITEQSNISGQTYALDVASGAQVYLSAGTYFGKSAAIHVESGDFASLLAPGCAYFDASGSPLLPEDVEMARTVVVKQCADHSRTCTANPGSPTHSWACEYCGTGETEKCTFDFDGNVQADCREQCGHSITVTVNESALGDLIYNGADQTANVTLTVSLEDGTTLAKDTDYGVDYSARTDVGDITVTVTGITFDGTFIKTYHIDPDQPGIRWDSTTCAVDYDSEGRPVDSAKLPHITINIKAPNDEDLRAQLQYSYREAGTADEFVDGLPTNAGEYEVKAYIPKSQNYEAAETNPCLTLTINKINALLKAPEATRPTYDKTSQPLVTAGKVQNGAVIEYAREESGPYTADIPTGVNAGDYFVWYRVTADTNNYNVVPETEVPGVEILRKPITPLVILSEDSFLYDGGYKRPGVTVKDKDDGTVLLETEYAVDYENNLNVSTAGNPAKAIVTDEPGGNYDVQRVEVEFEITSRPQETLSITQKPNSITYGDQFTLGTTGGSGSGDVTWEITSGTDVATVDSGGHVTVIGHGSATVKATKSGADPTPVTPAADGANYGDATDSWTFTAVKKPVVATVTAEDKDYDGNKKATVHAVVEQGVLPKDVITIDDLPGEFIDENAGVDKTVNVDTSSPVISGTNFEHYDVSYSSTTVKATIRKAVVKITTEPVAAALTYNGTAQALIAAGAVVDTAGIDVEYALSEEGPYSTDFPKATCAGNYTVWYRVKETGNYTGADPKNVTAAINKKPVSPAIALDQDSFTYDGTAKEPAVTLTEADGTTVIPDTEYTVSYSDNVNAGAATVAVTAKADGNYSFTPVTKNFTISEEKAQVVTAPKAAANPLFYNTYAQELVTAGTGTGGTMVYRVGDTGDFKPAIPTETNAGDYTVYYKVAHDANHSDSDVGQVQVTIAPKTVEDPTIELFNTDGTPLVSYTYDGTAKTPKVVVKDGSTVIGTTDAAGENDEYNVIYTDNTGAGKATVSITDKPGGNYTVSGTTAFQITKKAPAVTPPEGRTGLKYNGELQELVKAGACDEGTVYYSVNGGSYSPAIPTASAVGTYTITYKVVGDANHSDTDPVTLQPDVEIDKNRVSNPTITLSSDTFKYNGGQQKPVITVRDDDRKLIPENEYTVTITGTSGNNGMVDVDTYTITVTTPGDSNYVINSGNTRTYKIVEAEQETISITGTKAQVFYGDTIQLGTSGGTGSETITWTVTANNGGTVNSTINATGLLTVKDVGGPFTVTVKRSAGGNYKDVSATWEFSADKKPVTAEVTAADRGYIANDDTATVTATVPDSELVSGDTITITGLTGRFDNPNAGTNKKVTVDRSNLSVSGINWDKYSITYPAAVTASIFAAEAVVDTEPEAVSPLTYDASQAQELVTAGHTNDGIMVYSLDGANFTPNIPKGKDAGTYRVYYKAQGDGNHTDSEPKTIDVTIAQQSVTPQIELTPPSGQYDGNVKRPEVTVRDTANNVIPVSEYTVVYDPATNWKDVGPHKVTVKNVEGGNYIITEKDETFTISTTEQNPLEIVNKPGLVYYGDTFTLSTTGGSGSGKIEWSSSDEDVAKVDENGLVTIKGTGPATITAKKPGGTNYEEAEAAYPLNALKKPVTAIVTAEDRVYVSGNTNATIHVTWEKGALVGTDSIDTTPLSGTFADENVGTNKIVTITGDPVDDATAQKYDITIPPTTTASILKADAVAPALTKNDRDYNGLAQDLVTGGDTSTLYSDSRDGVYSTTVPQGTNAGTYTVWYKEQGDINHNDSAPQSIQVTIRPKQLTADATNTELSGSDLKMDTDGTYYYEYDGTEKRPTVTIKDGAAVVSASEYTVGYSDNKNVSTADKKATVTITDSGNGNYVVSGSITFEIRQSGAQLISSPQAKDLTYTGQEQELVTVGTAAGGHIEYALDNGSYGTAIPKAENAGTYIVSYRVVGDSNHTGGETGSVSVTIKPKQVISPKITVSGVYTYDGTEQKPAGNAVTVEDGGTPIPDTEYTLSYQNNVNAGTATVIVSDNNGGNYTVNGTATFEIAKADAAVETAPSGKTGLPYNGTAQELVTGGAATGGTMVYSLSQNGEYSPVIPTQTAVDNYTVWYKIQGDSNHKDTTPVSVSASIIRNTVTNPTIQVTPESVTYNGEKQVPAVTVWDGSSVIDGSEYTVTYSDAAGNPTTDLTAVGTYTLTITGNGNYIFDTTDGRNTAPFEILPAGQTPLTITGKREHVYYGDTFQLSAEGGNGTVEWNVDDSSIASISNGLLTIKGVGSVTVTAISKAAGYKDQTATWPFVAEKKPVTAVVTAAPKTYDGVTPATTTVTATLQTSDLVSGDKVVITLPGSFEDPNAGTNKKVTIDSSNPQFSADSAGQGNYNITYPATTTASIFKKDISAGDITEPELAAGLKYTGDPQNLVKAGSVTGGILEYSLDGRTYSASLPTGVNAGDYDVWYRVKGDGNHNDKEGVQLGTATIARQEVTNPTIEFTPSGASYDGQEHKPSVTVKDANGAVIPATEYTVSYGATDWIKTGDHTVTITGKPDGNYDISGTPSETFTILPAGQSPLTIVGQPGSVQYGDSFTLSAVGGSGTGAVIWEVSGTTDVISINSQTGQVEILKSGGPVTVTARKLAAGGYSETTASWTFSAKKKPVTPIVTARDKEYDTNNIAQLVITWAAGDLLANDVGAVNLDGLLDGTFDNANVGSNKNVTIQLKPGAVLPAGDKYDIKLPASTTASITPKAASVSGATATELNFNGGEQALVSGVTAVNGTLAYSRDGSYYTLNVPKETNAGTYTIWYKAQASGNYMDSPAVRVDVTIKPKEITPVITLSQDSYEYDGTAKEPGVVVKDGSTVIPASEYTVSYSSNTAVGTATVTVSNVSGGNYSFTGSKDFTIQAATASLKEAPQPRDLTYNGKAQTLVMPGTAVNGKVLYFSEADGTYGTAIPRGTDAGDYEVWYKVVDENGNDAAGPNLVEVTIDPKIVTPIIRLENRSSYSVAYNGKVQEPNVTVYVESKLYDGLCNVQYNNNINVGTAEVTVQSTGGNYQFLAFQTFEITKGKAEFSTAPTAKQNLAYTGEAQKLVNPGSAKNNGTVLYSLGGASYSPLIPAATDRGSYVVYAKVQGSDNYEESDVVIIPVEIGVNAVQNPVVTLSSGSFPYTGSEHRPTVTVTDNDSGNVIPADEYTVTYSDNVAAGTAKVNIKSKPNGNYSFTASANFQIVAAGQTPLTITGRKDTVYYGDTLNLGTTGGSGSGAVTWSVTGPVDILADGQYKINSSGSVTITAAKAASSGYEASTDTWSFYANPKPVTAVVTAADKPYDGNNTADLTATVNSGLVGADVSFTVPAAGHFSDANVGTNKTVVIDDLTVPPEISAKYDISWPSTTTASITQAAAKVTSAPTKAGSLTYNGGPQPLLTDGGTAEGGNLAYSVDGGSSYSFDLPTGTDAKTYTVWYKVVAGDENHKDSAPVKLDPVTIAANTDTPTVLCTPGTFQYDGTEKTPTVVVRDRAQRIIPESEYTVTLPASRTAAGTYNVTVTDKPGGNYEFTSPVTGTFEIVAASQNPLSIITDKPTDLYYGDTFRLTAMGGSGSGAIQWSIDDPNIAEITSVNGNNCVVTVKGTGGFTVEAYRKAADGYSQSNTDSVPFVAHPKPVTPVVTASDKPYDGKTDATLTASWKSGDLVGTDNIPLTVAGEFVTADVGTDKQVIITSKTPDGVNGNYIITWPESTRASISKVDAKLRTAPAGQVLTYNGKEQALVIPGSTEKNVGTIEYSLSQNGQYSTTIPTGKNAGKYTVWYRVADSVNYTGIAAAAVEVEIAKATPTISSDPTASTGTVGQSLKDITFSDGGSASVGGKFAWKDDSIKPGVGISQQDVVFTPDDTANYNTVEFQISVTIQSATGTNSGGSGTGSTSSASTAGTPTTVQNGTASTVLSASDGSRLVREAVANQSQNIVIKPEVAGDVTKSQVSIPASTVSQIKDETDAALTVSAPIADVTIPNAALDTLGGAGGTVSVVTEQVDQGVVLTLTAGGKKVENIPGGVTLSVPVENAGPGTVAVLVHDDGTRETIQKSVVEDGKVNIPLNGSATVEIVDNSKEFTDVPATNWAADAVAFASAHELFSGTSETTFSPDQAMSRGMLTTVLYNLEGRPEQDVTMQDLASGYSDVNGGDWYAEGVAWASENGIASGYGDGQFNPNDSVTREQFAVMLWKYAGSPQANDQVLSFADADQASGYAQEALCWAVEKGILNGYANGQLAPGGTTTRAQAAQMLKNFLENT